MKKFLCLILMILTFNISSAFAEDPDCVGFLARLKTTPEEFYMLMKNSWALKGWVILGGDHSTSIPKFFDTLVLMQMSLSRGEIDEMIIPEFCAEYILKISDSYEPSCISNSGHMNLCFGFMKKNQEFRNKWNYALNSMRNDFTLAGLEHKYIKNFPEDSSYDYVDEADRRKRRNKNAIKFETFKDSPTIRVAVTGDLPPVDFIGEDGLPAGYSTAVLAEIGRRLRVNIALINVSAGARTAALVSGKADVVFWYEVNKSLEFQPDVPDEVILSEPYLSWDKFIHLKVKE